MKENEFVAGVYLCPISASPGILYHHRLAWNETGLEGLSVSVVGIVKETARPKQVSLRLRIGEEAVN